MFRVIFIFTQCTNLIVRTLGKRMGFTKSKRTDFSKNASLALFFGKNCKSGEGHEWRKIPPKRVKNGENQKRKE